MVDIHTLFKAHLCKHHIPRVSLRCRSADTSTAHTLTLRQQQPLHSLTVALVHTHDTNKPILQLTDKGTRKQSRLRYSSSRRQAQGPHSGAQRERRQAA